MVQVGPGWTKPASVHGFPGPEFSQFGKLGRKEIEPSLGPGCSGFLVRVQGCPIPRLYVKKNKKTKQKLYKNIIHLFYTTRVKKCT